MTSSRRRRQLVAALAAVAVTASACGSDSGEPVVSEPDQALQVADSAADSVADAATESVPEPDVEAGGDGECPPDAGTDEVNREFSSPPPMCLEEGVAYSALVRTTAGDITVDLDAEAAPLTVNNFVFLARNNYFDDTVCHRVIQEFVAQCGDPTATGRGGPGYSFDDELPAAGAYEIGSIAMANSGPNTNGSQFFIISGPNGAGLPPLYNLFGQVSGDGDLEVVAEMNARGSIQDGGPMQGDEIRIIDVEIIES